MESILSATTLTLVPLGDHHDAEHRANDAAEATLDAVAETLSALESGPCVADALFDLGSVRWIHFALGISHAFRKVAERMPEAPRTELEHTLGRRDALDALALRLGTWAADAATDALVAPGDDPEADARPDALEVWPTVRVEVLEALLAVCEHVDGGGRLEARILDELAWWDATTNVPRIFARALLSRFMTRGHVLRDAERLCFAEGLLAHAVRSPAAATLRSSSRWLLEMALRRMFAERGTTTGDDAHVVETSWQRVHAVLRTVCDDESRRATVRFAMQSPAG